MRFQKNGKHISKWRGAESNVRFGSHLRKIDVPPLEEQQTTGGVPGWLAGAGGEGAAQLQEETQKELEALMPSILDKAFKGEL